MRCAAGGAFAYVCVNNVTLEPLRLKAGTGLCDVTFVPNELRPTPPSPEKNVVLRLPWLDFLRAEFNLSVDELNSFEELYQSRSVARHQTSPTTTGRLIQCGAT